MLEADSRPYVEFSEHEVKGLLIATHTSSVLSCIGSLFIIVTYLLWPNLRKAHSYLVFWLSVCDLCSSLAWATIPVRVSDKWCMAQGVIVQFFQIASFIWTSSIAIVLYLMIVKKKRDLESLAKYFHFVAWIGATVDVLVGISTHSFGDPNHFGPNIEVAWCWIRYDDIWAQVGLYYFPFIIVWFLTVITYIRVTHEVHKIISSSNVRGKAEWKIRLYLLVFLFCVGVGAINRIHNFIWNTSPVYVLYLADACCSPLQGFLNSVVYGMNKHVQNKWKNVVCCKKEPENKLEKIIVPQVVVYEDTPLLQNKHHL